MTEPPALADLLSESPADVDRFGFKAPVRHAAETLKPMVASKATVVVAVVGALGTGKSSFLAQLRNELNLGETVDVRFNAQLPSGSLWAALVGQIGRALYEDLRRRIKAKQPVVVCGQPVTDLPPDPRSHWREFAWWLVEHGVKPEHQRHSLALFADVSARLPGRRLSLRQGAATLARAGAQAAAQGVAGVSGLGSGAVAGSAQEVRAAADQLTGALFAAQPKIVVESEEFLTCLNELVAMLCPNRRLVITIEDVARLDEAGRRGFEHALGFIQGLAGAVVFIADDTVGVKAHPAAQLSPGTGEAFATRAIGLRFGVPRLRVDAAAAFVESFGAHTRACKVLRDGLRETVPKVLSALHGLTPRILKRALRLAWVMMRMGNPQAQGWWEQAFSADPNVAAWRAEGAAHFVALLALDGALEGSLPAEVWTRFAERYPGLMLWMPWCVWDGAEWPEGPPGERRRVILEGSFPRSIERARWLSFLQAVRAPDMAWIEGQRVCLGEALVEESVAFMQEIRQDATSEEDMLEALRSVGSREHARWRLQQAVATIRAMHDLGSEPKAVSAPGPVETFDRLLLSNLLPARGLVERARTALASPERQG